MGAGFYMMIAMSIILYRVAIADKKSGLIWFGVNLCVSMILGKLFGLTVLMAMGAAVLTFIAMFVFNLIENK